MEKRTHRGRVEIKLAGNSTAEGTLAGYGSVFDVTDSYGDIVQKGAFADSLKAHKAAGTMPMMLLNHNMMGLPIGVWDSMEEDATGLKCSGHFIDTSIGADAYTAAKAGAISGLSIGFIVTDFEMKNGNRIITGVELIEVSVVTFPANDLARISDVKNQESELNTEEYKQLHALMLELKGDLVALRTEIKATKDDDDDDSDEDQDSGEDCDCEGNDDCECEDEDKSEAKYNSMAINAINQLVAKLQQEKDVR